MDISTKVKLKIGTVTHELTIEELQELSAEIARLIPSQQPLVPIFPITYPPYYSPPSYPSYPREWWDKFTYVTCEAGRSEETV